MEKRLHLNITGRVHGVFYRASAQRKALSLGLTGWVRNVPDGSVEVLAEGDEAALSQLMEWCWQGPTAAAVRDVAPTWEEATGEFSDFQVRY